MYTTDPRHPAVLLAFVALCGATACKSSSTTTSTQDVVVAAVRVSGIAQPLLVGGNGQVTATVTNAEGDVLSRSVVWSSDNSLVATVGTDGTVAAIAAGNAMIIAAADGKSGNIAVAVNNVIPVVVTVSPASVTVGAGAQTLTVVGSGFVGSSVVRWNGADLATTFGSSTHLTAQAPAGDFTAATAAQVTVFNPVPGGGSSGAQVFTVSSAGSNPVPAITA